MDNEEFSTKLNEIKERVLSSSTPKDESKYTESLFESIKHIDENGDELWSEHFVEFNKMFPVPNGGTRNKLSRRTTRTFVWLLFLYPI